MLYGKEFKKTEEITGPIDWEAVREWDEKYYRFPMRGDKYVFNPVVKADGNYLYMADGSKLLDSCSISICVNMGQRHPHIQEVLKEAMENFGYVPAFFPTYYRAKAAKLIMEDILGDEWAGGVHFTTGGSMGVEIALELARLYTDRPNIITREHAYHGHSMAAASATRIRGMRGGFAASAKTKEVRESRVQPWGYMMAPAPYCYRCSLGLEYPSCKLSDGKLPCLHTTENLIKVLGTDTVAGIITEIFQGGGCIVPPPEYYPQLMKMKQELGILWIDDEIAMGFGRTGKWFGYQLYEGVKPDIMVIGKGLTNSAIPAGGIVMSKEICKWLDEWRWWGIGTFDAHPLAMAAAVGSLEAMMEINAPQVACEKGEYFLKGLNRLKDTHKCVGLVSGAGLWYAIELVKNKQTKEPIEKEDRFTRFAGDMTGWPRHIFTVKCAEKGVYAAGIYPNTLRIAPSFTMSYEELDKVIEAMDYAFSEIDKICD